MDIKIRFNMKKLIILLSIFFLIPSFLYARSLTEVLNTVVVENITSSEYAQAKKSGVYAYLSAQADTTITTASIYYPVAGTFTNAPVENFSSGTVYPPSIKYDGTLTQYFEIDWHATIKADAAATTVGFGVKKNSSFVTGSDMSTLCKTAGEEYSLSGTCIVELAQNDEIQLVVTSDGNGDIITVVHYTTSINEFFD